MGYKLPFTQGKGYTFYIEHYAKKAFVHCDVQDNFTPSTIKEMLSKWKQFRSVTTVADFYAIHSDLRNTLPHKKFLTMFGFRFLEVLPSITGEPVELWVNYGKDT